MAGIQVQKEDDRFFYLQSPTGNTLPVAKSGLSKERQEQYRSQIAKPIVQANEPDPDPDFNFTGRPERILTARELTQPNMTPVSANVSPLAGLQASSEGINTQPIPAGTPEAQMPAGNVPVGMPAQDVGMIPASQTVVQSVQPGMKIDEEIKSDIAKGYDLQAEAAKKQIQAQGEYAKAFVDEQAKIETEVEKVQSQYNLILQKRDEARQAVETDLSATIQKMQDAKVDPERWYGGSAGKRVLAGIAIAMGEFGRALTGGSQNAALKIINDAINADIRAQEVEIDKLGKQAGLQRQLLAEIDAKYENKITAQNMKRAFLLDAAERKATALAKRLTTDESIAQAQSFIGQLQAQKADALFKAQQAEMDKATIQTTTQLMSPQAAAGKSAEKSFDQASKLRQEYNKNPVTLGTIERKASLDTIEAAKEMNSAAGDLAFIFAYMKMLDPGSTVREGEFANAQNAAGVPDRIRNLHNRVRLGTRLSTEQRNDFYNTANAIYQKQLREQEKVDKRYTGLAERSGLPVEDVIIFRSMEDKDPREISATFAPSGLGR